jgi:arsenite oxidase small subunit
MSQTKANTSRRNFLKASAGVAGAVTVGIFAFPPGLETVEALVPGIKRVTRSYPRLKITSVAELTEGSPVDFNFPLEEHNNFVVKLGTPGSDGVGSAKDIVAFNYLCSHMGCPLNGQYRHEYKMMGPCPCHFSRFDLAKNGIVILGQATQTLPQIMLEEAGGDLYAVGVTGLVYGFWDNLENGTVVTSP